VKLLRGAAERSSSTPQERIQYREAVAPAFTPRR
jgi:hypothetical protein